MTLTKATDRATDRVTAKPSTRASTRASTRSSTKIMTRIALILVALSPAAYAQPWALDPEGSTLGFASVKNGSIAEGHRFTGLSGAVDEDASRLTIELSSVDTAIPIRDQRMRELLFEVADFPQAIFESDLGSEALEGLATGESRSVEIKGELSIREARVPVQATVLVTRTSAAQVVVSTLRPIVVSADALTLSEGLVRLRDIAGLESITPTVPVTFTLAFGRETLPERRTF